MKLLLTKRIPDSSIAQLENHGWDVRMIETLRITPVMPDALPVGADVWIASSRNSLDALTKFADGAPAMIYVVGKWMEERLSGMPGASIIHSFPTMKTLAAALLQIDFHSALYFCGDIHRDELELGMQGHPAKITEVITHRSEMTFPVLTERFDAILIFSPRSVESLMRQNTVDASVIFGCIGPTTADFLRQRNFSSVFCASYPDSDILVREFLEEFSISN